MKSRRTRTNTELGWFRRVFLRRLFGGLRVGVFLVVVALCGAWLAARSAHGHVGEAVLVVGRELAGFEELTGRNHRVLLNGEIVNLASAVIEAPRSEVLDRFERACQEGSVTAGLEQLIAALPEGMPEIESGMARGVLRQESGRDGMVACLVQAPGEELSLAERLARFSETLNLADVGLLRYVYARSLDSGGTHVLTTWTDRVFDMGALMAADGDTDAPGSDITDAPRPAQSVRLLTAEIEGTPYSTRIYESKLAPAAVLKTLDRDLRASGFEPLGSFERHVPDGRAFTREGADLLVFAFEHGSGSAVSMVMSGAVR